MIQFTKEAVTPLLAQKYLEVNTSNRRVREQTVYRYAKDMANGRWKEDTGEPIKVSRSGIILDGQHRLLAVVKSKSTIPFHFAKNIKDSVFDVLDTGAGRSASDIFEISGIKGSNRLPSIMVTYNQLMEGRLTDSHKAARSTNAMLLTQYEQNPIFWDDVTRKSAKWYASFAKILSPSIIGGHYSFFRELNADRAEHFMNQLATGIDVENNTISLLRTQLMKDKMSVSRMKSTHKMALIIKAWNFFIKYQEVKQLKFTASREDFPLALSK
jgi:hypothetical protein